MGSVRVMTIPVSCNPTQAEMVLVHGLQGGIGAGSGDFTVGEICFRETLY